MFAFLLVEKNLDWYRKMLMQTLGEQKQLQINPKNCIGTVLSLNGFRKYFCVYHAKHPELRPQQLQHKVLFNVYLLLVLLKLISLFQLEAKATGRNFGSIYGLR